MPALGGTEVGAGLEGREGGEVKSNSDFCFFGFEVVGWMGVKCWERLLAEIII